MTTIAVRDGIIAADSRETRKGVIDTDRAKKLYRVAKEGILGTAGSSIGCLKMLDALTANIRAKNFVLPLLTLKGTQLLWLTKAGVWLFENTYWEKIKQPYYAVGSGWDFAMCAMDAGCSAPEAVRLAKRDVYTGGRIQVREI